MTDSLRCPACGYTETDAQIQMDHNLCPEYPFFKNENPIKDNPKKDKDSQLDEIERAANNLQDDVGSERWLNDAAAFKRKLGINMFAPGGLYYEMRRENERLEKIVDIARKMNHADQMIIGQANRSQPYGEWQNDRALWLEKLNEALNPDDD